MANENTAKKPSLFSRVKRFFKDIFGELKKVVESNGQITLAEFRDIIGTSRKFAMAILDYLDNQKITQKVDDARVLI